MMKFFKKAAVVTLSVAMVTTLFAGCSSKKKDDKTWVIGTNAEFAPFEYVSKNMQVLILKLSKKLQKTMARRLK